MACEGIRREVLAYVGDDINDYAAMRLSGFSACPADACEEILELADYVSPLHRGGGSVLRDVVRHILGDRWKILMREIYHANT